MKHSIYKNYLQVPRGKWYCHGCASKAPPPKKRGPKKGHSKEPKSNNTSTQSLNLSQTMNMSSPIPNITTVTMMTPVPTAPIAQLPMQLPIVSPLTTPLVLNETIPMR